MLTLPTFKTASPALATAIAETPQPPLNLFKAPVYSEKFKEYIPRDLRLRPFQAEMIEKNLNSPSPIIYNSSEMGLGKTVESLVYASTRGAKRLLIVCPAALVPLWVEEGKKWLTPSTEFLVVSYQRLVRDRTLLDLIARETWDGIIFDEFHYCRSMTAERTFVSIGLWNSARMFVYLLSGTPIENAAVDLFPVLAATTARLPYVSPETKAICSDYHAFGREFCYPYIPPKAREVKYSRVRNAERLTNILYDETRFFFRDLRADKLPELPELQVTTVPIELTGKATLDIQAQTKFDAYSAYYEHNKGNAHVATVRRLLGIAKASSLMFIEYCENILSQGEPLVIMVYHQEVVEILRQHFQKYNPVLYFGETSSADKHRAKMDFMSGKSQLFIGNIVSAGVGITLTISSNIVILEWDWLPSTFWQAVYRLLRIGQDRKVTAHLIAADNPFDRHMMTTMNAKQDAIDTVIS